MTDPASQNAMPPASQNRANERRDPYRAGALPTIRIAPDRRPLFYSLTLALGVALGVAGLRVVEHLRTPAKGVSVTPAGVGLEGRRVVLPEVSATQGGRAPAPPGGPLVVHVWLQGCADCMPAFEAMRAIDQQGGLGVPQVNVAYGSADPAWAARYGVHERLVLDSGSALVSPLGISSFTTLVLDEHHVVRFVDRPDRPGYLHRVQGAFRALTSAPPSKDSPVELEGPGPGLGPKVGRSPVVPQQQL
ncbi:MAG: hypothetical protein IPF92_18925 [Myxococcales bacterium]|nr:hypothetical protein [Myxococcales bacterium]HQY63317.1 hypothetical protein [Polyangiaceae bacterium]